MKNGQLLKTLREVVFEANRMLPGYGLVTFTWGNVSGIDRESGLVVIKPSGIPYSELKPEHLAVVDIYGNRTDGDMKPSSDTSTHLVLYRAFPHIGGIVHTHSPWATSWAQAGKGIPALGTTHADYFYGEIPCTRKMTAEEIDGEYEAQTGKVIVETLSNMNIDPMHVPAVLANGHGPFCWGRDPIESVHNAVVLENIAMMAYHTQMLSPVAKPIQKVLLDRHFMRKHGPNAYYGQNRR